MSQFRSHDRAWIDSLRLSERDQREILDFMEHQQSDPAAERRENNRQTYHPNSGLIVQMRHPGGTTVNYLVRPRNLSTSGIGFLHGSFVYTGTQCLMALRTTNGKAVRIAGKVQRCQHVRGQIHEIGVGFDQPINLQEFLAPVSDSADSAQTSTELPRLTGWILSIDSTQTNQDQLRCHAGTLGVKTHAVMSGIEALSAAGNTRFDLIMTDVNLVGMTLAQLIFALRERGCACPVIGVTADDQAQVRADAKQAGCAMVLIKPYRLDTLATMLAGFLPRNAQAGGNETLLSDMWPNQAMRPLILSFVARLDGQLGEIQRNLTPTPGAETLQKLCIDLKGSAGGHGYPAISEAAARLLNLSLDTASAEDLKTQFDALSKLCHAAKRVTPSA